MNENVQGETVCPMVCLPRTSEILVAVAQEMAEGAVDSIVGAVVGDACGGYKWRTKKFGYEE